MADHPYGFVQDGKVYRKAFDTYPALEIGEVKDTPEAAFAYYENRFQQLQEKINQLEEDIRTKSNKGSYLMKLLHLKETLPHYEGLGDFTEIFVRLEGLEAYIREIIHQNRERNLQIKTALLQEAGQLEEITNWKEGTELAKDMKMRWLRTGSLDSEHQEDYEARFNALLQDFFDRRQAFYEDRQKMIDERQKQYEILLAEAQRAAEQPNSRQAYYDLRGIQQRWKEVGKIPAEHYKPLLFQLQRLMRPFMQQRNQQRPSGGERYGSRPGGDRPGGDRPGGDRPYGERTGGQRSYGERQQGGERSGSWGRPQQGRPQQRSYSPPVEPGQERLEERRALLERMKAIDVNDPGALGTVETIQNQYKELGFARSPEVARISDQLFDTGSLIRERHFLSKLAFNKVPGLEQRDAQEQARQKLRLLRDLLSRDERELQNYQENMASMSPGRSEVSKMMEAKLRSQYRKVKVKKMLLEELKQESNSH
ncbi:DUF349 domain-containing protein [Cesiribacter andamanensis]|uniref:DUF349 domain-containing protein n=1 Tax=Cesiribacter andamanensis AMV16 TaxID=1279009 RepID=M7N383_9BACT|nr:DUF349 domain-containing protein [Cesiribacter andamanensis]EMR01737.1 hypothetical protein ADICEAN_03133 [Cesiribacter andamanensis AMV16]